MWFGSTPFHSACGGGHLKIAEILMQKSAKLNIDLNAKGHIGLTAFQLACIYEREAIVGRPIVEMMKKNSESFKIDLTV